MKIILFGPQGAGKGVVGAMMSKKYRIPLLGAGQILREAIEGGTEVGKVAEAYLNEGNLVPPDVMSKSMKERVEKDDYKDGFILDGFPRNLKQDELFPVIEGADFIFEFTAPRELLIRRLTGRRICKKCGAVYNIFPELAPHPKFEGKCDKCGGELYQREDDKEDAIKKRLDIYDNETKPVIEKYKDKVHIIDTSGTPEENFKKILEVIENL